MDPAYFSAIAALCGSVVGGLTSLAASWVSQNVEARSTQRASDKSHREDLYRAFVEEASRLYARALSSDTAEIADLVALYAMVSRMRILCPTAVAEAADDVVQLIIATDFEPNRTLRDIRPIIQTGKVDPLKAFSEACREDLRQFGRL